MNRLVGLDKEVLNSGFRYDLITHTQKNYVRAIGLSRYEILLYHISRNFLSRYDTYHDIIIVILYAKIVVYVGMIEIVLLLPNKRKRTKMKTMCTMYNEKNIINY